MYRYARLLVAKVILFAITPVVAGEIPPAPHLSMRPPVEQPDPMVVHNWPSRAIPERHDRLLDWSFIAGHGIYAGALAFDSYETARHVGTCASEGNPDLGTDPGNRRLVMHGLVEFGAVVGGDLLVKWAARRNKVPRWMAESLGVLGASIGTAKHVKGGMDWVRLCQ